MTQPAPRPNDHPAVIDLHRAAYPARLAEREADGLASYGVRLQPFNGRDPLDDGDDELTDAQLYSRQARYERDYINEQLALLRTNLLTYDSLDRTKIEFVAWVLQNLLTMNHYEGE